VAVAHGDEGRFADRVVILTGAGSGIGRAAAIAFARAGACVLGVGRREEALAQTAGEHARIGSFAVDIRSDGAGDAVVRAAVERWGRLDVLVNNAGAMVQMPLAGADPSRMADLFALNVIAPSMLASAALPHLSRTHGSIVNVSSTYGHRPAAGVAHYAASKSALEQLTRCWALELASDGVRVNALAPGPTESQALAAAGLPPDLIEQVKQDEAGRIPLGRRGRPEEVAEWIMHLADPTANWLTGQVLTVDGGLELV
jgi:NAD(P)-dependent dehydrogenase (short-subunit alcohol dehydrogenase family)